MPREKLGVVVLTSSFNPAPVIISRSIYDRLMELDQLDWIDRFKSLEAEERELAEQQDENATRKKGTSPSHALTDYTGRYEHPAYGAIAVQLNNGKLEAKFHTFTIPLTHYHYDVFQGGGYFEAEGGFIKFEYNFEGDIDRLSIPFESDVPDIIFRRVPGS